MRVGVVRGKEEGEFIREDPGPLIALESRERALFLLLFARHGHRRHI